jgi:hypothetical protein
MQTKEINKILSSKHIIQEDKADEVKALVARYVLLRIEQKKIESKLNEITRFYDEQSLRTIFEPIGDSMMGIIGIELPRKKEPPAQVVDQKDQQ